MIFKISISTAGSVRLLRTGATAGTPYSYMINKVSAGCSECFVVAVAVLEINIDISTKNIKQLLQSRK